jgi:hypothetical protein
VLDIALHRPAERPALAQLIGGRVLRGVRGWRNEDWAGRGLREPWLDGSQDSLGGVAALEKWWVGNEGCLLPLMSGVAPGSSGHG